MMDKCIFCDIVDGKSPADILHKDTAVTSFRPLHPYVPGHVLFVPNKHIVDVRENPLDAALVFKSAVQYLAGLDVDGNILTSAGAEATQTVFHLHIHVLPRGMYDGLDGDWPWMRGSAR